MSEDVNPSDFNSDFLGQPNLGSDIAAGAELLAQEQEFSMDAIKNLGEGDSVHIDCGFVHYILSPTALPQDDPAKVHPPLFTVTEAVDEREGLFPLMTEGTVILVDGTSAMPSGTMLKPNKLIKNGYLGIRVPMKASEDDRAIYLQEGFEVNEEGYVKHKGTLLFMPTPSASELMNHITVAKADGKTQSVF